jgi:hypothetical protein
MKDVPENLMSSLFLTTRNMRKYDYYSGKRVRENIFCNRNIDKKELLKFIDNIFFHFLINFYHQFFYP